MPQQPTAPPPPYVGFGVFSGVIETLAETTIPNGPIDRRVLDKLSGADYGAFMSAAKFFGLVDENRTATPRFRELVAAFKIGPEKYKATIGGLMEMSYDRILVDQVELANGTAAQLEKAFKEAGVQQCQMLTKTIRFLVKGTQFHGGDVSPHILKGAPPRQKNGDSKPRPKKKQDRDGGDKPDKQTDVLPTGFERMAIPGIAGAYIQYPVSLTEQNCDVMDAMMVFLRAYAKARAMSKEKKP